MTMVFSSETFLFLFLPLFLASYYSTPAKYRSYTIVAGSYVFYAWWRVDFLALLVLVTAWAFAFGILIERQGSRRAAKNCLALGVGGCLAVLGIFKYLNFFIDSFADLLQTSPADLGIHLRIILPIGISFFIFQAVSYLVDVYRKEVAATRNPADFAAFIALFPQLIAGPILRFRDLEHQFRDRVHSPDLFGEGMTRFAIGLAKKVLVADAVAPIADAVFGQAGPTMAEAWLGAAAYALQLYFDFSGYSDMAIGLGMMMGFRFEENFDMPYRSRSITEFWRRWHISLSRWLRDYLYVPLGGNRSGTGRTYVNLMVVMVLGGLWHGANWTFVLWGAWHGAALAAERALGWTQAARGHCVSWPLTMLVVLIGWVMFRSADVAQACDFYAGMLGLNGFGLRPDLAWQLSLEALAMIVLGILAVIYEPQLQQLAMGQAVLNPDGTLSVAQSQAATVSVALLMCLTLIRLADQSYSPFLYFQF